MRTLLVMKRCSVCRYRVPIEKWREHMKAHALPPAQRVALIRSDGT